MKPKYEKAVKSDYESRKKDGKEAKDARKKKAKRS
jgi:hypothetical protein